MSDRLPLGGRPTGVTVVSVNVAVPAEMPGVAHRGRPVRSGIAKIPTAAAELALSTTNLAGDGQADLSVHGGPDKAVYAYPSDHWTWWATEVPRAYGPGTFGENLSTSGATEAEVCIGDRWTWGDALLEVCQPRTPCYKLALHTGTAEVGRAMRATGRCGWYLRVLRAGTVATATPLTVTVEPHPAGVSVAAVTAAGRSGHPDAIAAVLAVDALADEWRVPLRQALAG